MKDVYIVSANRTAIGSFGGSLKKLNAIDLGVPLVASMIDHLNIEKGEINEVIIGNVFKMGIKGNPARQISLRAGLDYTVPAMTIDKQCGSGMKALMLAANEIRLGNSDLILTGGIESMTNVPHLLLNGRWGSKLGKLNVVDGLFHDGLTCAIENYHMGVTAENLAEKYKISREEQDEFSLFSQEKASRAIELGLFQDEIVPINTSSNRKEGLFQVDEYPRKTSLETLSKLSTVFKEGGTVTAGNSSGLNDGAAMILLASQEAVEKYSLKPLGKVVSYASAAVKPSLMGLGPVPATKKALEKAKMTLEDIDLFEINEAFAAQVLAVNRELNIPEDKLNVNGGAIALGHPVGSSGARIMITLLNELKRQGKKYGLASLCIGGGQGVTTIIEAL